MNFSPQYNFVRGRQLEGTFPGDAATGIWPITSLRIQRGWGAVPESAWPYDASNWPPVEPPGLDEIARAYRHVRYRRVYSSDECKSVLSVLKRPVMASFDTYGDWFNAPEGRIPRPVSGENLSGGHSILLIGYDDATSEFKFRNSWGPGWGDRGNGYLPYDVFDSTCTEAWTEDLMRSPARRDISPAVLSWAEDEGEIGILHCHELVHDGGERIAWAFAVEGSGLMELEELFVIPRFRKRGNGTMLTRLVEALAQERACDLRAWVPHVDCAARNLAIVERLFRGVGFKLRPSPQRWAGQLAELS